MKLPDFLKQQLKEKKGNVVEIMRDWSGFENKLGTTEEHSFLETDGKLIGEHIGAHFYTIGQRKGLNIGGYVNPLFIIQTNTETNTVYVGEGEDHQGLSRPGLLIQEEDIHWVKDADKMEVGVSKSVEARIRYRQPLFGVTLIKLESGLKIKFDLPQKAVAKGQFAAWYAGDVLVGSGVIN